MTRLLDRLPAAVILPGATIRTRTIVLVTLPVALAAALALLWYDSQRVLGLDAFYYVEYTKQLTGSWPTIFGTNWPRGYPLLAALGARLGLSPFAALVGLSGLSLAAMTVAAASLLPREQRWEWTTLAVFSATCAAPVVPLLLGTPMSELLFASLLLLSVFFVTRWPEKSAIRFSMILGFSAFCIRYAGIFMLGLLAVFLVLYSRELRREGSMLFAAGWYAAFAGLTALLLWSNIQATGHISGADRGFGGGFAVVPEQLAHLGWAAIGMISSTRIDDFIGGVASPQGLLIGWIAIGAIAAFCTRAAVSPKEPVARPLALLVLSYLAAFVAMRALRHFPDINDPRYVAPVLFPLVLVLLLEVRLNARRHVAYAATAVLLVGVLLSTRGVSEATYGDVAFARNSLDTVIRPDDVVRVNAAALSLAAYYPNAFEWDRCETDLPEGSAEYVVVTGKRLARGASTGRLDECGLRMVRDARRAGYDIWRTAGSSMILQRSHAVATKFSARISDAPRD